MARAVLQRRSSAIAKNAARRGDRLLGVPADYTRADVLAAFRRKAKTAHPDAGGSAEAFQKLVEARDRLLASLGEKAPKPPAYAPSGVTLVYRYGTDFCGADITGCRVYGIAAWDVLHDDETKQEDLIITPVGEPRITVDNLEVAQFIYLLLRNDRIRNVVDAVAKKAVLILGHFGPERKVVLDALRDELRRRDYLPILFDFDVPKTRDITETVSLLAHMARFIIADLTDPSSIPKELEAIVPSLAVPVQPILEGLARPYAMFNDYWKYDWVLSPCRYEGLEPFLATIAEKVITPAETTVKSLEERRRAIEPETTASRT
jgi:hypothetical protein